MGALGLEIISLEDAPREKGATEAAVPPAVSHCIRPVSGTKRVLPRLPETYVYQVQRLINTLAEAASGTPPAL